MASVHSKRLNTLKGKSSRYACAGAIASGLTARWDVLRWVPFLGVGLGRYQFEGTGGGGEGGHWGAPLKMGVEYLFSRGWLLSAQVSGHVVVRNQTAGLDWALFTVGLGPRWGF